MAGRLRNALQCKCSMIHFTARRTARSERQARAAGVLQSELESACGVVGWIGWVAGVVLVWV